MTGPEAAQGLARGIHVAGTLSICGAAVFLSAITPPSRLGADAAAVRFRRGVARLIWGSFAGLCLGAVAWLGFQAATFADGNSAGDVLAAVPLILVDTRFGPLLGARLALLLPACLILGSAKARRRASAVAAAILAILAVTLQVLLGHGFALQGDLRALLVGIELLHVLAAAAWLGGLMPLLLLLGALTPLRSIGAVQRFSTLGLTCVAALAATSLIQAWTLIGGLPGLFGTDYGRLALTKLALFAALLLLAALNRYRLRPGLLQGDGRTAHRLLMQSILGETALGLAVLLLAGMLLMLAPAARQQPDWPFPWALHPAVFAMPKLRLSLLCGGLGLALVAAGALVRPIRAIAAAAGGLLLVVALTQAGPLLVPAHPTSFYRSPTGFTAASIAHGRRIFAANCASCHDDPESARPGDRSDGDLFWLLAHGKEDTQGQAMPGFRGQLSDGDLWSLIDFLKAGAVSASGPKRAPSPAPDLPVTADGRSVPLSRLRGRPFGLVALDMGEALPADSAGLRIAAIEPGSDGWTAYAIVAGVDPDRLRHFVFLVDAAGGLRGVFPPKQGGFPDLAALDAAASALAR